eukprot:TRINITY_DN27343_c0_g1_i1.p1 TRINITY_DN27343_c0_g1~~TRINITY_DN27343_c0_g1_i1.p1  ORF type:complete len:264 (-),score=44.82 TRINITY_DN27343_c0_g1_i1:64-855(-)
MRSRAPFLQQQAGPVLLGLSNGALKNCKRMADSEGLAPCLTTRCAEDGHLVGSHRHWGSECSAGRLSSARLCTGRLLGGGGSANGGATCERWSSELSSCSTRSPAESSDSGAPGGQDDENSETLLAASLRDALAALQEYAANGCTAALTAPLQPPHTSRRYAIPPQTQRVASLAPGNKAVKAVFFKELSEWSVPEERTPLPLWPTTPADLQSDYLVYVDDEFDGFHEVDDATEVPMHKEEFGPKPSELAKPEADSEDEGDIPA